MCCKCSSYSTEEAKTNDFQGQRLQQPQAASTPVAHRSANINRAGNLQCQATAHKPCQSDNRPPRSSQTANTRLCGNVISAQLDSHIYGRHGWPQEHEARA
ncbi:hypothetical protein ABBQ38_013424 [Trebouxia sp. C0009 RCD-2024]